jgi:hypothetical protein
MPIKPGTILLIAKRLKTLKSDWINTIMLQLVSFLTLILLSTAAFFAWMQNRSTPEPNRSFLEENHLRVREEI